MTAYLITRCRACGQLHPDHAGGCGRLQGEPHAAGCRFYNTIRRIP